MEIQPIARRESAVDACARTLREAILEGELAPGEKLLPERELAQRLGVNRVTIRSALGRLRAGRLLDVRQGSGHRVLDYRRVGGPELLPTLLSLQATRPRLRLIARDLLLVRRMLIRGAVERLEEQAREGVNRQAVTRLRRAVRALANEQDEDRRQLLERVVFDTIVDEAGGVVLPLALNPFLAVLERMPRIAEALAAEAGATLPAWETLVAGLERGTGDLADEVNAELARCDLLVLSHLPRR